MSDKQFAERVYALVALIPRGRVMTYGQIAGLCGNARASRIVGGIAHFGPPDLPWQRVVNKQGGLAAGYPGGREGHKKDLGAEGVEVFGGAGDYRVDVSKLIWHPNEEIEDRSSNIEVLSHRSSISDLKTIYIVGPTASGKTALSIELAKQLNAEVICADSQTIRRDMNIGTAKPTVAEMDGVRHHMLDVIDPYELYSAADYQKAAQVAIKDIHSRGKVAIVVGGTGLYVDALYYDFAFPKLARIIPATRIIPAKLTVEELQQKIIENGLVMPENNLNRRHLENTLLRNGSLGLAGKPAKGSIIVGVSPDRQLLVERINSRVDQMFDIGFVDEVRTIIVKYGAPPREFDAIGYRIVYRHLNGEVTADVAKELFKIADRQYAKRQISWFKRNKDIHWFSSPEDAKTFILNSI